MARSSRKRALRKEIVATKEGGAIAGEPRLRGDNGRPLRRKRSRSVGPLEGRRLFRKLPALVSLGFAVVSMPDGFVRAAPPAAAAALGLAYDTGWSHDENSGNGYAYFSGTAFVDCAHTRVGYRQSADLFTGGYAHAPDGGVTSYADMGVLLENDDVEPGRVATPNKVQLYGQASTTAGRALLRFADGPAAPQHRLDVACDTPLRLTFFVANAREIDVRYTGTFVSKRGGASFRASVTAKIVGFVAGDGWSTRCARCAVRRVETLAVGSGVPTRSGSYFGIDAGAGGRREPAGRWTDGIEGRFVAGHPGERTSYACRPFAAAARDIVDAPADATTRPRARPAFVIRGEGTANERFGLDEREPVR